MSVGLLHRRSMMQAADEIIITRESNAPVMDIMYAKGLCANADYMTLSECKMVTSIPYFYNNTEVTHFEEFMYFTGVTSTPLEWARGCSNLRLLALPLSIVSLGEYGLFGYTDGVCTYLIYAVTPPSIDNAAGTPAYIFRNPKLINAVYVPDDSVDAYKAATHWSNIASKIHPLSEYTI